MYFFAPRGGDFHAGSYHLNPFPVGTLLAINLLDKASKKIPTQQTMVLKGGMICEKL